MQASQDLQEVKIRDFLQFLNHTLSTTALYNFSLELCLKVPAICIILNTYSLKIMISNRKKKKHMQFSS